MKPDVTAARAGPPTDECGVLLVAAGPITPSVVQWVLEKFPGQQVSVLPVDSRQPPHIVPADWAVIALTDLGSLEDLRREYLDYLERIPESPIPGQGTLNGLFRRRDGYSLWWTDVGVRRSPTTGIFLQVKAVWMVTRAIEQRRPRAVVIDTRNPREAAILFSAARQAPDVHFAPDSVLPARLPMVDLRRWYQESIRYVREFTRHRLRRFRAMRKHDPRPPQTDRSPTVMLACLYPRHLGGQDGSPGVWYWHDLADQLSAALPTASVRYLMDLEVPDAWPLQFDFQYLLKDAPSLRAAPSIVPLWRGHASRWRWAGAWLHQFRLLRRYYRLEGHLRFRSIFRFRGVDLSPEWIIDLRHSISMAIWWESEVDAATAILRTCGNVRLVLVHQEFEVRGLILLAACRRLGIQTVGVQHGTFSPLHTIYTLPEGQMQGTPIPDFYAVYGDYHKEVVSQYGHYPANRVWVCAGARFDEKANRPPVKAECRRRLGIPVDQFVILVTTQSYPWFRDAVRATLQMAPPGSLVCIKAFDGDPVDYRAMIEKSGRSEARVFTDQFEDLLGAMDVLVSGSSTTVMEATLIGKPTVCLNFSTEPFYYPYVEEGVSIGARGPEDLRRALHHLRSFEPDAKWHERRLWFLDRHLGPAAAGKGAAAFAAKIREVLSEP